ncbi:hypothetical protein EON65_28240 [archaeon]|nr:MAG: hypothetical protein EON65_28240 [archaeon]
MYKLSIVCLFLFSMVEMKGGDKGKAHVAKKEVKNKAKHAAAKTPVKTFHPNASPNITPSAPSMMSIIQQTKAKAVATSASKDNRDKLQNKLDNLTSTPGFRKELIVGFNSINKALENDELACLCIHKKASDVAMQFLLEACKLRQVSVVIVPIFSSTLRSSLHVKSAFCFGLRKRKIGVDNEGAGDTERDMREVAADELKDYLDAMSAEQGH